MSMLRDVCNWTSSENGQVVVGASVLVLGLTHFGYGMGIGDMGIGPLRIGTIAGAVGVVVGACVLANRFM
jgi:hypothetical protein